ncbi:2-dehydro-3-deoxy-6-phosphogalactonate aldolase [Erwiniaceae bacterium L1_54_6]|jgi:2-dehydro-3-deoxyphosphogalactonate aldolase|nr:2-dehydro-3-deoxy-6-phosphogalactonate aldolase [Erwiniaceae bacterium L1_54_6]
MSDLLIPDGKRGLIAILRGIKPEEVVDIGFALVEAGIEIIEVPLNSPAPFESISRLIKALPADMMVGAGTVLNPQDVNRLADCGGRIVVSPNVDQAVIGQTRLRGMLSLPGVFTATEAFQAIAAGASGLKFFPAAMMGVSGINALRAVIPPDMPLGAVGGIEAGQFGDYLNAGIHFFGLGSNLYKPGDNARQVSDRTTHLVRAWDAIKNNK